MRIRRDAMLAALGTGVAAVFAAKALAPGAALFRDLLTETVLLRVGGATKLLLLFVSWHYAARSAASLEPDNPARRPWRLFSLGLLGYLIGQAVLSTYQVVLGASPYPSPGDVFFLAGYPLLIVACFGFVHAYREAGLPVGSFRQHAAIGAGAALTFLLFGYALFRPVLASEAPLIERALTVGYPALDFVLLIPILILLRVTAPFHGGRVFRAWSRLLLGVVFQCAGDILYAFLAGIERHGLDPLVDATFVLAYFFLARGTIEQHELLSA